MAPTHGYDKRIAVQKLGFQIHSVSFQRTCWIYWADPAYPYLFYANRHGYDLEAPNQIHLLPEGYDTNFHDIS